MTGFLHSNCELVVLEIGNIIVTQSCACSDTVVSEPCSYQTFAHEPVKVVSVSYRCVDLPTDIESVSYVIRSPV